jgi:hypothetical protein
MWFTTFTKAKQAAIMQLNEGIQWRKSAIAEIRKIKKKDFDSVKKDE